MRNFIWNIFNALIIWVKDNKDEVEDIVFLVILFAMLPFLYAVGIVFLEWIGLM